MRPASRRMVPSRRTLVASSPAPASSTRNSAAWEIPRSGSFRSCAAACAKESRSALMTRSSSLSALSSSACRSTIPVSSRHSSTAVCSSRACQGRLRPRVTERKTAPEPRGVSRSPRGPTRTGRSGSAAHRRGSGRSTRVHARYERPRSSAISRTPDGPPSAAEASPPPASSVSASRSVAHTWPGASPAASRFSSPASRAPTAGPVVRTWPSRATTRPSAPASSLTSASCRSSESYTSLPSSRATEAARPPTPTSESARSRSSSAVRCSENAVPNSSQAERTSGPSRLGSAPWQAISPHRRPSRSTETDIEERTPMLRRYSRWKPETVRSPALERSRTPPVSARRSGTSRAVASSTSPMTRIQFSS